MAMRFEPDFESFCELACKGGVVPVSVELVADTLTPVEAFALVGKPAGSYLLESVVGGERLGRYSFVGFAPEMIVRGAGDRFERQTPEGTDVEQLCDPWEGLRALLAQYRCPRMPWLPQFWGGAVGYIAYDAVRRFEPTVGRGCEQGGDSYDFCFAVGGTLLIFDNLLQTLRVVHAVRVPQDRSSLRDVYERAVWGLQRTVDVLKDPLRLPQLHLDEADNEDMPLPASSFTQQGFCDAVERAREYIRAGDIFQVVLSQCFRVPSAGIAPFDVYRAMRIINPSPYNYFLRFPEVRIAGASPETLVKLQDGVAHVRPIAGTRRRSLDPQEDEQLEQELLADAKETAEHVMLVDLGRNDLGRISRTGSVRLTDRMVVERYSHVMHIVSNVTGEVAPGYDAIDVLRATFPAGTLSGAPKVRAMQIIDELEPIRRGIYGGAVGYISFEGSMDTAIAIRTVLESGGEYRIQAGAGIVEASKPQAEYQETINKARASLNALAMARHA